MQTFDLPGLLAAREQTDRPWLEFLRAPSLSSGVYHLKTGRGGPQRSHAEDKLYYVLSGRGHGTSTR